MHYAKHWDKKMNKKQFKNNLRKKGKHTEKQNVTGARKAVCLVRDRGLRRKAILLGRQG